jgi:hypothetical protein
VNTFDPIEDYQHLFQRRFEALMLGEILDEAIHSFEEAKRGHFETV